MGLDENVSRLIGRIYESADDPARWAQVVEDVRAMLNAKSMLESLSDLQDSEMRRTAVYGNAHRPEGESEYLQEMHQYDPSFRWVLDHPYAKFCDIQEIMGADSYLDDEFIRWASNEWIGATHWLVGFTPPEDDLVYALSVHGDEVDPLTNERKALFKLLFEHMERAIRLRARPPLFAAEGEPLILLDRLGRIREMTPAARALVDLNDGLSVSGGELRGANAAATGRLNAAVVSALGALSDGSFGGAVSMPRPSGKRDLLITVSPLVGPASPFEVFHPAALLRIVDPELGMERNAAARWACLFNLTPAEARLAESLIVHDWKLRRAAEELGVSYATARVHLKHLLEKTGTHNQGQLARLLSRVE